MDNNIVELKECDQFRVVERTVICGGEDRIAFRAFPTMVNFGDGGLLVGYDLARDHHVTPPMGLMTTRSLDAGRTWEEPFALCALPGYNVTGNLGLMKCPDGSLMCKLARYYYPGWRHHGRVSCERPGTGQAQVVPPFEKSGADRRFQSVIVRSWDKGYNWTPANFDEPFEIFPGRYSQTHCTGDSGPHELSDGRWMMSVQGTLRDGRWLSGVVFSEDAGATWSPVQVIYDLPYGSPTEQRVLKLDGARYLSYQRVDTLDLSLGWSYENNVIHFSLSEDEGSTWGEPWKGDFMASGAPEMVRLRDGTLVCFYRDMDYQRAGLGVSLSTDEARTWEYLGRLAGPSDTERWGWPCEVGYPVAARLPDQTILLVFYGPATEDGNADIVGVFLEDRTHEER